MFDLRPASYDDPDAVALTERAQVYYVQLYGGPDDDPLQPDELRTPAGGFVIGYRDGAPIAMGGWSFAGEPGVPVAHLRRMFVDAGARRGGWAAAVLDCLESDAVAHGATSIVLATGTPQVAAIAFYRARGYADIPAFGYYADSPTVVCLGKRVGVDPRERQQPRRTDPDAAAGAGDPAGTTGVT